MNNISIVKELIQAKSYFAMQFRMERVVTHKELRKIDMVLITMLHTLEASIAAYKLEELTK